jgi:23S rRNA (uracil1939-C5)-methyltransferase
LRRRAGAGLAAASGPDSAHRLHPAEAPGLVYTLPEFGVSMAFRPTDFTGQYVDQPPADAALDAAARAAAGERIADLFCGLGNFSLPIAALGAQVVGVAQQTLVRRAGENAAANGLAERCEFYAANLFEPRRTAWQPWGISTRCSSIRRGSAIAVVKALGEQGRSASSMCPATGHAGPRYRGADQGEGLPSEGAGIANMFPQTSPWSPLRCSSGTKGPG